jgi:hypothetical protein
MKSKIPKRRRKSLSEDRFSRSSMAKIIDELMETTRLISQVSAYRSNNHPSLIIKSGESERQFLERAKLLYRANQEHSVRRGRPSIESRAFFELARLSQKLRRQPRYSEVIRCLTSIGFAHKTAEKYERAYRLVRKSMAEWSSPERAWLVRQFGNQALSFEWWADRLFQCWSAKARTTGESKQIGKIMSGSVTSQEMSKMRTAAEKRRKQLIRGA